MHSVTASFHVHFIPVYSFFLPFILYKGCNHSESGKIVYKYWDTIFDVMGCHSASSGNTLPTFRDNLTVSSWRVKHLETTFEDATDGYSRNVGKYNVHCVTSQKSEYLINITEEVWDHEYWGRWLSEGLTVKGV
jgi:hypothetical protein